MTKDSAPKAPFAGIIYGEIAYWLVIIGMIIALAGLAIYMTSGGYLNKAYLLEHLWKGADYHTIWVESGGIGEVPHGHWYLGMLSQGDAVAMLGIAFSSIAAVIGMWGALFGMLRSRERTYIIFALIIAVTQTLSVLGILSLEH